MCYRGACNNLPQCLPGWARIATPFGDVPAAEILAGTLVYSTGAMGERVIVPVSRVVRAAVSARHRMMRLELDDGREVQASFGHPLADRMPIEELRAGDVLDGARVLHATPVAYTSPFTYDLLPDTASGSYWSDGVLIGSTLLRMRDAVGDSGRVAP